MQGVPPTPPSIQDMPAGTRLFAGLGVSTITPDIDFETYSEASQHWNGSTWVGPPGSPKGKRGLNVCGAAVYAEHPSSEVLMMSYDLKDGTGKHFWRPGLPPPADLFAYIATGGPLEAHNAMFERLFWELVCVARMGWPPVKPEQWRCSAAKARAMALPGALAKAGAAMNLPIQKDKEGERLIKKFCEPRKPTKTDPRTRILTLWSPDFQAARAEYARRGLDCSRLTPAQVAEDHADTLAFQRYNITDIAAEAELSARCPDLEGEELQWWQVDQAVNRRGIRVDVPRLHDCAEIIREVQSKYGAELMMLTGIDAASKAEQILGWLAGRGLRLASLDDEAVTGALERTDLAPECRRVLEIRAACASASVKKVFSMLNNACADDRIRNLYVYHGARTGRDTSQGPQAANVPGAGPSLYKCGGCGQHHAGPMCPFCSTVIKPTQEKREWNVTAAEQCVEQIKRRSMQWLEWCYGDALHVVAGVLRAMYVSAPGKDFISTDYNSIEAVGLAELCGEKWRIQTFNTHGKIYEQSAATMFGVPFEEMMRTRGYTDAQLATPKWWEQKPANPGAHHPLRKVGKVAELACLAPETKVLTDRGLVPLIDITRLHLVWDGVEWVKHQGLVSRGRRQVIALDGARMTPDHKVLCGTSWLEASRIASSESTLTRALASCLETSCSSGGFLAEGPWWRAAAWQNLFTSSPSGTYGPGEARGATPALLSRAQRNEKSSGSTRASCRTRNTAVACSIAWLQRSLDAAARTPGSGQTTGAAGSESPLNGLPTAPSSCAMQSHYLGGTGPSSKWIESTTTSGTRQGTFGSSARATTQRTSEACATSSSESTTWSDVYDIAHAGPRNRFTIATETGFLIVHNCGYQGWVGSAHAFGMPGTDEEIKANILAWRDASPSIPELWGGQQRGRGWRAVAELYGVEGMAVKAIQNEGVECPVMRLDGTFSGITYVRRGSLLYCRLPSGRNLHYHNPRLEPNDRAGWAISFEGWNTNPVNGPMGWIRMRTWGGRLVENINQAVCRDILRWACIRLEQRAYPVVMRTYDEIVCEIAEDFGSHEEFEGICTVPPPWAATWPIRAPDSWRAKRYRKG